MKKCEDFKLELLDNIGRPSSTECFSVKVLYLLRLFSFRGIPYGLAVRIPGFHPGGPGSTPGMGITIF